MILLYHKGQTKFIYFRKFCFEKKSKYIYIFKAKYSHFNQLCSIWLYKLTLTFWQCHYTALDCLTFVLCSSAKPQIFCLSASGFRVRSLLLYNAMWTNSHSWNTVIFRHSFLLTWDCSNSHICRHSSPS